MNGWELPARSGNPHHPFYNILAIDPGVCNLAFVCARINLITLTIEKLTCVYKINLLELVEEEAHYATEYAECGLYHTLETCDLVAHFLQESSEELAQAQLILIEQQPLTSAAHSVQQLLMCSDRDKYRCVHPASVHRILKMPRRDPALRKERAVEIATPYLGSFRIFANETRKHDMADALCLILAWCDAARLHYIETSSQRLLFEHQLTLDDHARTLLHELAQTLGLSSYVIGKDRTTIFTVDTHIAPNRYLIERVAHALGIECGGAGSAVVILRKIVSKLGFYLERTRNSPNSKGYRIIHTT